MASHRLTMFSPDGKCIVRIISDYNLENGNLRFILNDGQQNRECFTTLPYAIETNIDSQSVPFTFVFPE